jgi:hypothetical protein
VTLLPAYSFVAATTHDPKEANMKTTKVNYVANQWQRYVVCILALLVVALSPAYASQPTAGVSFAQISFTDAKYSHYGQVSIDFTMLYGEGYINVEQFQNGEPAGWLVKNLPVINSAVLPGFSTMFDLGISGYQSSFSAYVDFSPTALADDSSLKNQSPLSYKLAQAEYPVSAPPAAQRYNFVLQKIASDDRGDPDCYGSGAGVITWKEGDFSEKSLQTKSGSALVCLQNLSGAKWKYLKFSVTEAQKKVTGNDEPPLFEEKGAIGTQQYQFSKVNDLKQTGVPNGKTVRVLIGNFDPLTGIGENHIKIQPAKEPPAAD